MSDCESKTAQNQSEWSEGLPSIWAFVAAWIVLSITQAFRDQTEKLLESHQRLDPLLSIDEVADVLGVSKRTVEDIVGSGKLDPIWVKGQRRFHPDAVNAYLRRQVQTDR